MANYLPPLKLSYTIAAVFMLLVVGGSRVSFASSDYQPCNYTYHITYYDSPSSAGTINGYSNGQTQTVQRNNVPCGNSSYGDSAQASPSSGYLFSSWSSSSSISLSSTTVNPTDFSMGPGSGSITANYVIAPAFGNEYIYSSSGGSPSSGTIPSPTQYTQPLSNCSARWQYYTNSDQYVDWTQYSSAAICQGVIKEGATYINTVVMNYTGYVFNNGTLGPEPWYAGNVSMALVLMHNDSDITDPSFVAAGVLNIDPVNGNKTNYGDLFFANYQTSLYKALIDMYTDISDEGQYYATVYSGNPPANQTLHTTGLYYESMSFALENLAYILQNNSPSPGSQDWGDGTGLNGFIAAPINPIACAASVVGLVVGVATAVAIPPVGLSVAAAEVLGGATLAYGVYTSC